MALKEFDLSGKGALVTGPAKGSGSKLRSLWLRRGRIWLWQEEI